MKPAFVKNLLLSLIAETASQRQFFSRPDTDFSRNRKLYTNRVIEFTLSSGGGNLNSELLDFFNLSSITASSSALVQQRSKLSYSAFEYLFNRFSEELKGHTSLYLGYRLYAVDGSDLHIPTNPLDTDSFFPNTDGKKPYNLLHLNALHDLLSHTYREVIVQKGKGDEHGAALEMMRRSQDSNVILIADRLYESYNLIANAQEKGWKFLIRAKEPTHTGGIVHTLDVPKQGCFDSLVNLSLCRSSSKTAKRLPNYKHLNSETRFDFLPTHIGRSTPELHYDMSFRVVRFKITEDSYETVLTNLPRHLFPPAKLKELYALRWGIETSFRDLKHTIGLLNFHSKKTEFILQEVFAAFVMYNYAEVITHSIVVRRNGKKYQYKINFTGAFYICRQFFLSRIPPSQVEALISKYVVPIRPERHVARNPTAKPVVSFLYRVS